MKNKINDQELETVVGGTQEEIDEIIKTFRKHGFEAEAKKLEKGGVFFFKDAFDKVMKDLGYEHELTLYADDETYNFNIYNGNRVGQMKFIEVLDEFLYRKANNIDWM